MRTFLQHVKYKDDDITGIAAVEIFNILWKAGRMNKSDLVDEAAESLTKSGMKKVTRTKSRILWTNFTSINTFMMYRPLFIPTTLKKMAAMERRNLRKGVKL